MEQPSSPATGKEKLPELLRRLELRSVVACILSVLSPLLQLMETAEKLVLAPAFLIWLSVLVGISCLFIWELTTSPVQRIFTGTPHAKYRLGWAIVTCICAMFAVGASGWILKYQIYHQKEMKRPMSQPNWSAPDVSKAKSLWELFAAANPALLDAAAPKSGAHLVFVMGAAGEGKGLVVDHLEATHPNAVVRRLCQRNGGPCKDTNAIKYLLKPELTYGANGEHSFNEMSAIDHFDETEFFRGFDASPLVLIDDLDEIHPDSATSLLNKLAEYISKAASNTQVLVFGRPEAFAPFYRATNPSNRDRLSPHVDIAPPAYNTQREFELLAADWAAYIKRKKGIQLDHPEKVGARLFEYARRWNWVYESVHSLYLGNFLCESLWREQNWKEDDLKNAVIGEVFHRAQDTHGRPEYSHTLYRQLILEIAAESANKTDTRTGLFSVRDWTIPIRPKAGETDDISVERVLSLSGLAELVPADFEDQHWRFSPQWLHAYLVDEYNRQEQANWWAARFYWLVLLLAPLTVLVFGFRKRSDVFAAPETSSLIASLQSSALSHIRDSARTRASDDPQADNPSCPP